MRRYFEPGDMVLLINAIYNPEIIGHVGIVRHGEAEVTGKDKFGRCISGTFVIVDLPGDINRHGTTLWYLKPRHLIKLFPSGKTTKETTGIDESMVEMPYNQRL